MAGSELVATDLTQPQRAPRMAAGEATWQASLRLALRSSSQLLEHVGVAPEAFALSEQTSFPTLVPMEWLQRIRKGDPTDPLLLQVIAQSVEQETQPEDRRDPVGDNASEVLPGLLHKYEGRVLLVTTGACAVHCRYCFRRHFPYSTVPKKKEDWKPAIDWIESQESIHEVILSGGDPLMLTDDKLLWLVERLNRIPHLSRLRVHSRLPVLIPHRVSESLLQWIDQCRLSVWFVLHTNHANEIDAAVASAIDRLRVRRCTVLNQAVLLRGVNDSEEALIQLCERLLEVGVVPYYLHQLDPVEGASHFKVPREQGLQLVDSLRKKLPGFAVPRYVEEIQGESHKVVLR